MNTRISEEKISENINSQDEFLSKRFIELDPKGYFLIKLDQSSLSIVVEHYSNDIDDSGRAINPETGKPIKCKEESKRKPLKTYIGKSAKDVGIKITEEDKSSPVSKIDHALYLGRELQRAEECLKKGTNYVQD